MNVGWGFGKMEVEMYLERREILVNGKAHDGWDGGRALPSVKPGGLKFL